MSGKPEGRSEPGRLDQLDPPGRIPDSTLTSHNGNGHVNDPVQSPAEPVSPPEPDIRAKPDPPLRDGRADRLAPGSLADLRQRLERLPYGHPSSPYHVDGERKPPPPRLKHLELAPPTPSRFTARAATPAPMADPADEPVTEVHDVIPAMVVDHDEEWMASPAPADAESPTVVDSTGADSSSDVEAPAELAGPYTTLGGSWVWGSASLSADQARVADDAYDRFRAAEGRNIFGSYGSTGLTTLVRTIARNLEYGELASDTEHSCLLDADTFKARFAGLLSRYPDRTAERLALRVPGAITYSFIFDAERYSAGIWMVQDALASYGFQLLARRNDWSSSASRCVSTMWHDPSTDLPFGVQFHTTASLAAQKLARSSAALINDPRVPSAEAAHLESDLAAAWAAVPAPPGNGQIADYRRGANVPPRAAMASRSSTDGPRYGLPPDQSTL